jgi:hypothetical protein
MRPSETQKPRMDKFQFQNGAIKSSSPGPTSAPATCFNSKMVRLKEQNKDFEEDFEAVSIPKWCD